MCSDFQLDRGFEILIRRRITAYIGDAGTHEIYPHRRMRDNMPVRSVLVSHVLVGHNTAILLLYPAPDTAMAKTGSTAPLRGVLNLFCRFSASITTRFTARVSRK